jgi:hypothetical protein
VPLLGEPLDAVAIRRDERELARNEEPVKEDEG